MKLPENTTQICLRAIQTWGEQPQVTHAISELGELSTALARFQTGRGTRDDVREEIADVLIMCEQLALIFGVPQTEAFIPQKLAKLQGHIRSQAMKVDL